LTLPGGGQVVKRCKKMERPNPKTFVGTGKIEEIHLLSKKTKYQPWYLMMNCRHPSKKNISKIITECKILDRTHLILDILRNVPKLPMREHRSNWRNAYICCLDCPDCGRT
jgi:GTP-binding protein HflX